MGFMANLIHRRLPRVVFQAAALSTSKWTRFNPSVEIGRRYQSKNHSCVRDNRNKLDRRASPVAYKISSKGSEINPNEQEIEDDEDCSFDDHLHIGGSKPWTKAYAARLQFLPEDKQIDSDASPKKTAWVMYKTTSEVPKNSSYDVRECYDIKQVGRAFQQLRPEYKSMCYSSDRAMETSTEECDHILEKVTPSLTAREVSKIFEKLSYLPQEKLIAIRSDERFLKLLGCGTENLPLFTNSEIICILGAFVRLGIAPCPMFTKYKQEFCVRLKEFSTNEMLLVADSLYYMDGLYVGFVKPMYQLMQQRCFDLTLPQLIELMHIIGGMRRAPKELMEKIEVIVLGYISSMKLEEISIVCLAFFKTQNRLSLHLMEKIGSIFAANLEQVSNFALVNVLKMFRFSREFDRQFFSQVGQEASKRAFDMPVQAVMHVILAFASMRMLHKNLMNAVALTIIDRLPYCRSKDLAKFLWSFAVLGYKPPNADVFFSAFVKQIQNRLDEFMVYPEHFLTCLMAFIFYQQFPLDLISVALSKRFILHSSKVTKFELKKDLFTIAASVEIECPQYTGKTISPKFRKEVTDMLMKLSTREFHNKKQWIEVGKILRHILGGPQYVKEHMILPHTRSKDFEVHLDVNGKPVPINTVDEAFDCDVESPMTCKITDDLLRQLTNTSMILSTSSKSSGVHEPENLNTVGDMSALTCSEEKNNHPAGQSEVSRLAIQVTNRNQYLSNYLMQLAPLHKLKRRQLKKLGYVVVEVPYWEWLPFSEQSQSEKITYLRQKVFSSIKS